MRYVFAILPAILFAAAIYGLTEAEDDEAALLSTPAEHGIEPIAAQQPLGMSLAEWKRVFNGTCRCALGGYRNRHVDWEFTAYSACISDGGHFYKIETAEWDWFAAFPAGWDQWKCVQPLQQGKQYRVTGRLVFDSHGTFHVVDAEIVEASSFDKST